MATDPKTIQDLFLRLSELATAERPAALDRECGSDAELRQRVEALLEAHDGHDSLLDRPIGEFGATLLSVADGKAKEPTGEYHSEQRGSKRSGSAITADTNIHEEGRPGAVIAGRYTMLERLGEGGMGDVWAAKQTEPVKRKVAIKLIKMGMDSRAVLQRFEQERQALAMMDHPNISRVLDAGMTPSGQPFFVMELVNGLPLNKFCDAARLTLQQRLELFVPICNAVQHAHHKGIVHRDLKPANILVTQIDGRPMPKVIDFGVAKATAGKLTEETMSTGFGAVVGTLEYMSPEQAGFSNVDIDTRADIYSLGVILYELLTGLRPIDAKRLKQAALTEMIRIIQEEEASKPSTRLSTDGSLPSLAAVRQIEPRKLLALLRGDLDWVVMKCLEKQRERRYETANELARDIQRYLDGEAVEACPPSVGYRLRKFLDRHRGLVASAATIALLLLTSVVGIGWFAVAAKYSASAANLAESQAKSEKAKADQERSRAEQSATEAENARDDAREESAKAIAANNKTSAALAHANYLLASIRLQEKRPLEAIELLESIPKEYRQIEWYLKRLEFDDCDVVLRGHTSWIESVAYHSDGQLIASGSADNTIKLWDARTGTERMTLAGHTSWVTAVAFSPKDRLLASSSVDRSIKLWNIDTGELVSTLNGHTERVNSVAFTPAGDILLSASSDNSMRFWSVSERHCERMIKGQEGAIARAVFSPDGSLVASTGWDGSARLWDATSGDQIASLADRSDTQHSIAFSPSGAKLAICSRDGTTDIWDIKSRTLIHTLKEGFQFAVAFSPDETGIVGAWNDGLRLLDVSSGEELKRFGSRAFTQHGCVSFSPDGARLATGCSDGTVRVHDVRTGSSIRVLHGHQDFISTLAISPDSSTVVSGGADGTIRIWDVLSGQERHTLAANSEVTHLISFSANGDRFATAGNNESVQVWDLRSGRELHSLPGDGAGLVEVMWLSPDGMALATVRQDGWARLHDLPSGSLKGSLELESQFHADKGQFAKGIFSPDGNHLVITNWFDIHVFDTANYERLFSIIANDSGPFPKMRGMEISHDGELLAVLSESRTLELYQLNSGQLLRSLPRGSQGKAIGGGYPPIAELRFCDQSTRLIVVEDLVYEQTVSPFLQQPKIISSQTGQELATFQPTESRPFVVAPNSAFIAFGGDSSLELLDLKFEHDIALKSFREFKARLDPRWHREQAELAESANRWYAATFHRAWILKSDPTLASAYDALHSARDAWLESLNVAAAAQQDTTADNSQPASETGDAANAKLPNVGSIDAELFLQPIVREMLRVPRGQ